MSGSAPPTRIDIQRDDLAKGGAPFRWLDGFRRPIRASRYLLEVDGLRFVAIGSVLIYHLRSVAGSAGWPATLEWPFALARLGHYGVELFFAISGFILALPFVQRACAGEGRFSYRQYFVRRVTRIEPPYVLAILLLAAIEAVYGRLGMEAIDLARSTVASLFYCHDLAFGQYSPLLGVAWSLEVEVQFYLVMPLIALVYGLGSGKSALALAMAMTAFALAPNRLLTDKRSMLDFSEYFLAGLLVADLHARGSLERIRQGTWDLLAAAAVAAFFLLEHAPEGADHFIETYPLDRALPLLIVLFMSAALRGGLLTALLRRDLIAIIGGACYSLYLTHFVLLALAAKVVKTLGVPAGSLAFMGLFIPTSFALVLGGGAVYYRLIERPCMDPKWPMRLWTRLARRGA